jgi:glycosyltransferase involved in cell wall biosynthesis
MRIIQIIDSLEAGGAERMAVHYANALVGEIDFSGLVATRKEGALRNQIQEEVSYLFLDKKNRFDLPALFRLRSYLKKNKVNLVHAHGTSFFTAVLLKFTYPTIKIIWHEHYGARVNQSRADNLILIFSSLFFSSIFVVNHQLEVWVKKCLFAKKVYCIPNFALLDESHTKSTFLRGSKGKRIVCLANLKNPKNHFAILIAFKEMKLGDLGWSLHLIGQDYNDSYSACLKEFVSKNNLGDFIHCYGSQNDVQHILSQATIGILASTAEGFPVSLLEYGLARLPVLSTNVGYCPMIIKDNFGGLLFDPSNALQMQQQLRKMISDKPLRDRFGLHLQESVLLEYSKEKVLHLLLSKYKAHLNT